MLYGIHGLLRLALSSTGTSPMATNSLLSDLPHDVRQMVTELDLKPESIGFVCCPQCYCCYPLGSFPDRCENQEEPGGPMCNRILRKSVFHRGKLRLRSPRRYLYQDMKLWMGRFICRPDMEGYLDRDVFDTGAEPGEMRDIWDGEILPNFTDRDGLPFVGTKKDGEGRYIFGLNMDGFNPSGNKQGGKTRSYGAIYMVCLNLPPALRYQVENIFLVCIIPGPHHPSLVQINHLLRPLVNDLLEFWERGVFYSKTPWYSKGRLVRCALIPVICDLLAARQMMAFASHASNCFCCYCGLHRNDMDNVNMSSWPPGIQSREEYVAIAERWRDAPNTNERKRLFERHGVRYT